MCDHNVEMGLDAERILEEEIYQGRGGSRGGGGGGKGGPCPPLQD